MSVQTCAYCGEPICGDDCPPPRSRDDIERDIRNWRGPIIPRGLLPDDAEDEQP